MTIKDKMFISAKPEKYKKVWMEFNVEQAIIIRPFQNDLFKPIIFRIEKESILVFNLNLWKKDWSDRLFGKRKLKRLVAIDLKLGKFKPKHKAQMELYLRWLEKHEMQEGEEKPIGLLLCSEGNTKHIELLMLDEKDIKVAQYLTELPNKERFADKLHRAIEIAKMNH